MHLDDPARLAAVDSALEVDERQLTELVARAAATAGMPTAVFAIVGQRTVLFRAHVGLPSALTRTRAIAVELSPCAAVVLDEFPLAVGDASVDAEAPAFFRACSIRAYVGVPVHCRGLVVGALAAADPSPRRISGEMVARLSRLGRELGEVLSERRSGPRPSLDTIPDAAGVHAALAIGVADLVGAARRVAHATETLAAAASPGQWHGFLEQIDEALLSQEELAAAADDLERIVPRLAAVGVTTRSIADELARVRRSAAEIAPLLRLAHAARAGLVDAHMAERSVSLLARGTPGALLAATANVVSAARLIERHSDLASARLASG